MKICNVIAGVSLLAASIAFAQGPLNDRVEVNLPYSITVNKTVLPPGNYVIRQHESTAGGSRVLHFFSDGGMKLETTAMAIPALDNRTPDQTKLVLEHLGPDYYLNKIWVQGKDYGYEFPIPDEVLRREHERNPVAVVGEYKTTQPGMTTGQQTATIQETRKEERTEVAQAAPPPQPPPVAEPEPAPAPAQVAPAEPAPAPAPVTTENRVQADQRTMPVTAGNWMNFLIGGSLLAASGLALRRFQRS